MKIITITVLMVVVVRTHGVGYGNDQICDLSINEARNERRYDLAFHRIIEPLLFLNAKLFLQVLKSFTLWLIRIHTIPSVPIVDCFQKIRQQVKCYLQMAGTMGKTELQEVSSGDWT